MSNQHITDWRLTFVVCEHLAAMNREQAAVARTFGEVSTHGARACCSSCERETYLLAPKLARIERRGSTGGRIQHVGFLEAAAPANGGGA